MSNIIPNFNSNTSPYLIDPNIMRQQLSQYNQVNNYNITHSDKYNEIQKVLDSLSNEEKAALSKDSDFVAFNTQYEQGLLSFIASQFRNQFNSTPEGIRCLEGLDSVLGSKLKIIKNKIAEERTQMMELSELIKNNPEILQQLKNSNNQNKETK